ncbi:hypothetical protein SANTM175S_10246 [Streptomyces antimycoticus]
MPGAYSALQVSINGGVAHVVIDHPPLNLLDATRDTDPHRVGRPRCPVNSTSYSRRYSAGCSPTT